MADTPEQGTDQAVDEGGTTATTAQGDTGGASDPDAVEALKQQLEAQKAEAERVKQRYAHAERKIREQGTELGRYRQLYQDSGDGTGQPDYGADTSTSPQGITAADRALARASWSMLAEEIDGTPAEKRELREKIERFLEEDPDAHQFIRSDPYHTYRSVVDHWQRDKEAKELEELRKWKAKADGHKDTLTAGAIVSGAGAGERPTAMSREEFGKLPREEQRKVLTKLGLYKP